MSGVKARMPLALRPVIIGAASQRPSFNFSPHWPKMTKCFPEYAAENCSSVQAPVWSNFTSMENPPGDSTSAALSDVCLRQNRVFEIVTNTGSARRTEIVWPSPPASSPCFQYARVSRPAARASFSWPWRNRQMPAKTPAACSK